MSDQPLHELDSAYGKRVEFGEVARATGRTVSDRAFARLDGAMNLLTKAIARLDAGEVDAADRSITRAADMPYDDHHDASPGVRGASSCPGSSSSATSSC